MSAKPHLYLFFGDDDYTIHKKVAIWKVQFEKKFGRFNITSL